MPETKATNNANRRAQAQSRPQAGAPGAPTTSSASRSTPPYNPGLQRLVDGKQAWAIPLDEDARAKGFRGWHQRGYLPHYDAPGITQIVTLRLLDSLPASRRGEWEHLLGIENDREPLSAGAPACSRLIGSNQTQSRSQTGVPPSREERRRAVGLTPGASAMREANLKFGAEIQANNLSRSQTGAPKDAPLSATGRERRRRLEEFLDRGLGECWLHQPAIAKLTEEALRFFDGQRYHLAAWVVMPNHVHLLVEVWEIPLSELLKSWKSFVARKANQLLGRRGEFWEREYLDTVIEDETHRRTAVRYIEKNPVKAGLVREAKEWPWSSARFRDEYGALKYPATQSRSETGAPAVRSADVSSA